MLKDNLRYQESSKGYLEGLKQDTSCSCLLDDYGILLQVKSQFSLYQQTKES